MKYSGLEFVVKVSMFKYSRAAHNSCSIRQGLTKICLRLKKSYLQLDMIRQNN